MIMKNHFGKKTNGIEDILNLYGKNLFIYSVVLYVMHQQDHLLSCQLGPAFSPAWKECGAIRLSCGTVRLQLGIIH